MKRFGKFSSLLISALLALVLCFSACGDDLGIVDGKVTIKFDPNLEGTGFTEADVTSVNDRVVEVGSTIVNVPLTIKGNPVNTQNLGFRRWCTDREGENPWDFSQPVERSMTLYAKWEPMIRVYYHVEGVQTTANVFRGEKAQEREASSAYRRLEGWYTTENFAEGTLYDFDTPVTGELHLYAKLGTGIYINGSDMSMWAANYGTGADGSLEIYPGDATTIELVGEGADAYCRVHFAKHQGVSYIYDNGFSQNLYNLATGERLANRMRVTYKNLGAANRFRFYYVAAYLLEDPEDPNKPYLYSPIKPDGSYTAYGQGGWSKYIEMEIRSDMSEDDEWVTVTVDLIDTTIQQTPTGPVSELGTASALMIPRIEAYTTEGAYRGWIDNNDVLFQSIEFFWEAESAEA